MKYYIDTEFIAAFHKPLFGKRRHFIDLISIGIVAEDGREYYAVSNEFDPEDADQWVKDNVLNAIVADEIIKSNCVQREQIYRQGNDINAIQKIYGKSNEKIAAEIIWFIHQPILKKYDDGFMFLDETIKQVFDTDKLEPTHEFYGYYADYDWVLFCSLFGRMIDLPKGFPMYCKDLKQMLDEKVNSWEWFNDDIGNKRNQRVYSFEDKLQKVKELPYYPKQVNEHNALADAKWNMELHKFLNNL